MNIKIIEFGCPICESEVRGNAKLKYFCKNCNLLFKYSQLNENKKIKGYIDKSGKIIEI